MGDAASLQLDGGREQAISNELAEKALAKQSESQGTLATIASGLKGLADDMVDGVAGLADDVRSVGEAVDGVVGKMASVITDPIKKGLKAVASEITGGMDTSMMAGMFVGALISFKDKLIEKLTWVWENADEAWEMTKTFIGDALSKGWELLKALWPHIQDGLVALGNEIISGLGKVWEWLKTDAGPAIAGALKDIGTWIWDQLPGWLQKALGAIWDVWSWITGLGARFSRWLSDGMAEVFRAVGLDTLASIFDYLSEALDAIVGYLGGETKADKAARESLESLEKMQDRFVQEMKESGRATAKAELAGYEKMVGAGESKAMAGNMTTLIARNQEMGLRAVDEYLAAVAKGEDKRKAFQRIHQSFYDKMDAMKEGKAVPVSMSGSESSAGASVSPEVAANAQMQAQLVAATNRSAAASEEIAALQKKKGEGRQATSMDEISANPEMTGFAGNGGGSGQVV